MSTSGPLPSRTSVKTTRVRAAKNNNLFWRVLIACACSFEGLGRLQSWPSFSFSLVWVGQLGKLSRSYNFCSYNFCSLSFAPTNSRWKQHIGSDPTTLSQRRSSAIARAQSRAGARSLSRSLATIRHPIQSNLLSSSFVQGGASAGAQRSSKLNGRAPRERRAHRATRGSSISIHLRAAIEIGIRWRKERKGKER